MAKYRSIFLEEATDHLGEISRALFELEKEMANAEAIDTLFRMAHSIKSMAASLGYDAVADLSHRMEDRMEGIRAGGRVRSQDELALLFRALEALEAMVEAVSNEEDPTPADEALLALLGKETAEAAPSETLSDGSVPDAESQPGPSVPIQPDRVGGEPKKVRR